MERYNSIYKEAKQVGIIYHFTTEGYAEKIVNDGFILKSNKVSGFKNLATIDLEEEGVSFTRNYNFDEGTHPIRFDINGTTLSDHYKIGPFLYAYRTDDEMEERTFENTIDINKSLLSITIKSKNYYRILPIKLYESIDTTIKKLGILETTLYKWVPELYSIFDDNLDTIINNIPIYIVNDFKPYNWLNTKVN